MRLVGRRTSRDGPGSPYRQGLVNNLSNPKMPIFFTSLVPQFGTSFAALAAHGVVFAALTLSWLALVLGAFGVRLATERR